MNHLARNPFTLVSTLAFTLACPDAFAGMGGGTISYSPYAQSVPTLSEAMLVVLAFLFAVLAFRALRAYPGGKPLASLLAVGVLALAASSSGTQLIQDAMATVLYYFDQPGGSVVNVANTGEVPAQNISGQTQHIISVSPDFGYVVIPTSGTPQCTPGLVVPNSNTCYVYFGLASQ